MSLQLADPPGGAVRRPGLAVCAASTERLVQGREQGEERDMPPELIAAPRGQRETLARRLTGRLPEQHGFADAGLAVHQQHTAEAPLSVPEQVTDELPFGLAPVHA